MIKTLLVGLLLSASTFQSVAAERAPTQPLPATSFATLASAAGAALNTDLLKGGGTDDTAVLQAVLDRAAGGQPVHLLIDGAALVSGLNVYSNTTIECLAGGGLYLKDQASRDVIRNVHRSRGAITDEHITIRGCFLNGNRMNQLNRPPSGDVKDQREPDGTFVSGVQLLGVKDVQLEHLTLWNMRSFGIGIANAEHIRVRDVRVDNGSPPFDPSLSMNEQFTRLSGYMNTDGVHLNGPIHDAILDGLTLHTGDDAVALNANDMGVDDVTVHNEMGPYIGQGPITDVIVTNVVLAEAAYGIRLLSSDQRIDRVIIQNVTGTVKNRAVLVSHWITPTHTGNFGSVLLSDINVKPLPFPPPKELFASIHLSKEDLAFVEQEDFPLFSLNAAIESLSLQRVVIQVSDNRPLIKVGPHAAIQSFSADFTVLDPELQSVPLQIEKGGRIDQLHWALDWRGKTVDVGKPPILNHGGVVRQLHWVHTPPTYVRAQLDPVEPRSVIVTFSQPIKSTDFKAGVTIRVNGAPVHILGAARQGTGDAVRYQFETTKGGDAVTWAYDCEVGTIQNLDGNNMLSVAAKRVSGEWR